MELLSTNVNHKKLKGARLLIYGTCIDAGAPRVLEDLSKDRFPLHICLTKEHMNNAGFKLATILMTSKPKEIAVLTIDGSPHCLQLHFAAEQAKHIASSNVKIQHYVVEHGRLIEVSYDAVKTARHLSWVQRSLQKQA